MKKLLSYLPILLSLLFASCASPGNENNNDMLEANRNIYKAIEAGDSAALRKYIDDDAIDHGGAMDGGNLRGEEIISMLSGIHNDIDNLKMEVLEDAASDDHVFALVHMTGTTNKPVWGMPANTKIDNKSIDLTRMKDGKVVDHWGYYEMADAMKMMQNMGEMGSSGIFPADSAANMKYDSSMIYK
jgi:predicted SnoaL-like aldol condensation-catalyzing enzyme